MRFRLADSGSANYLNPEAYLNNIKLIPVNSGTELVLGVGIVDSNGNIVPFRSATGTLTQVADTASDTLILAANTLRVGATIYNDSSALLYLVLGTTTASATVYSARVYPNGYYEVPFGFTGQIRGIWATDPGDGGAKITELT